VSAVSGRCYLVYALAPPGTSARQASSHPLTFSLTGVGFSAQTAFTLESYRDVSLEQLAAAEPDDSRYWWRRSE
jgi:hypothetical protein